MNRCLLVATAALLAGSAAAANAADLAARTYTKAPAPMAVAYDWSGFYAGLNGGGGWSHTCWTNTSTLGGPTVPAFGEGCHDATGGLVGGQIGYRWQAANWVFGLEGQGDWASLQGSNASLASAPIFGFAATNQSKIDAIGLITGQVGYAWNNVLWYAKGGAAVVHDKYQGSLTVTSTAFDRASETRWGAAVGTGLEVGFAPNWSVGVEYDHLFLGTRDVNLISLLPPAGGPSRTDRIKQDLDMVTVRLNYRFGGPVVAKY
ncbi:outer membrane beta-barrel protein [Bradyrhizobium sp. STM 3809]|uniref:outer membrane protein n=1 Tax=Bradyrhizobium sp. STM 3809 TaxID=551936 RepID=UPI000240A301|nr:outer membrane beta-barrel protein [Bradyrhizobium sp. STM 3809]CCE03384.1 putative outer-membrane protein; secreted protein [Bradyrhizobium sp. STM 3809]